MRNKLLVLFILMAVVDTAGKMIERAPAIRRSINRAAESMGVRSGLRGPRTGNNLDLFRAASGHLADEQDLYARYPKSVQRDRFKYSPAFAMVFTPLAELPWGASLFLFQLINALALFYALTRLLKGRAADMAIAIVVLEVWRSMQNIQSNALVAACIVLAFVAYEHRHRWRAAWWIAFGAAIKVFPVAAVIFALRDRRRARAWILVTAALALVVALPLLVTPPQRLWEQYLSWFAMEQHDQRAHMQSVMGMLHFVPWLDTVVPNPFVELAGLAFLLLPVVVRPDRWKDKSFRLNLLSTTLIFVVIFNPQAERASYVIAFTGIAIWYVTTSRTYREHILFGIAAVGITLTSTLVPGQWVRTPEMMVIRLVVPCLLIWARITHGMLTGRTLAVRRVRRTPFPHTAPHLSLVVPVHHREGDLQSVLNHLARFQETAPLPVELVIVDDRGPAPDAAALLDAFGMRSDVTLLRNDRNRGKGYSVARGMQAARGKFRVFTDADLAYPLNAVWDLVSRLERGSQVAIASRVHPESTYVMSSTYLHYIYTRHLMSRTFNTFVRLLLIPGIHDTQAGLKGFSARAAEEIFGRVSIDGFGFDLEVLYVARHLDLSVAEVPVLFQYRDEPTTVRFARDSRRMLTDLGRIRWRGFAGVYDRVIDEGWAGDSEPLTERDIELASA